mmetsp:Transcript_27504/g.58730  ORF Transcript_27504/g.58730 Transcript_27504/m.58730 type:complete len:300 (-) Transcript_27504:276-1175(-)
MIPKMMNKKTVLTIVGAVVIALAIGLGVGFSRRNPGNDKYASSSNAETDVQNNFITSDVDECEETNPIIPVEGRRILVLENDGSHLVMAPRTRRHLRVGGWMLPDERSLGGVDPMSFSLSMSFSVSIGCSKSGKSSKGSKSFISKKKGCKKSTKSTTKKSSKSSKGIKSSKSSSLGITDLSMSFDFDEMSFPPTTIEFGNVYNSDGSVVGDSQRPTLNERASLSPTFSPTAATTTTGPSSFSPSTSSPSTESPTSLIILDSFKFELNTNAPTSFVTSGSTPTVSTEVTGPPTKSSRKID